jgi:hypothetical protein
MKDIKKCYIEIAIINDIKTFNYDVFVYGGRLEYGEPHFHFADKIKGGNWQFLVQIPIVEQWKQSKELYIIESSNNEFNWSVFKKEKKELIEWLDKPNIIFDGYTNLQYIRLQWNGLNIENKNVSQLKNIV